MADFWTGLQSILGNTTTSLETYYTDLATIDAAKAKAAAGNVAVTAANTANTQAAQLNTYIPYMMGFGALMLIMVMAKK